MRVIRPDRRPGHGGTPNLHETQADDGQGAEVGDLPAEVGATLRCTLDEGTSTTGVTATVTQVTGSDVEFNIKVDSPTP